MRLSDCVCEIACLRERTSPSDARVTASVVVPCIAHTQAAVSSQDALQGPRVRQVSQVWQVSVCGGGDDRRWIQVAQDLLQLRTLQEAAGQHELHRASGGDLLQTVLRQEVRS